MPRALIVGGLTVDRFTDGTRAPGGSVFHSGRAVRSLDADLAILTVAGEEPEAAAGLTQLQELGTVVHQPAASTATYRHEDREGRRVLIYEAATDPIRPPTDSSGLPAGAVTLFAPIADEVRPDTVAALRDQLKPVLSVLLIQGWLRRLVVGEPVHPLPMDAVHVTVWRTFSGADVVVVSTEDLAETPEDPFAQIRAVRERIGDGPLLLLTLGTEGYLLDDPRADRVLGSMPRRVVTGVPTVGAGDTFGAALGLALAEGTEPSEAAEAATDAVIRMLESRTA